MDWDSFLAGLFPWQTLIGALIALPLTFIAILVPVLIERHRLNRRFIAARAVLPLHLSAATGYAISAGKAIAACRSPAGVVEARRIAFVPPPLPQTLVSGLEMAIEATAQTRVARRLAKMIAEIQVLDARMSTLTTERPDGSYFDSMLLDAGTVHALACSLFDFAREQAPNTPRNVSWASVVTGLHLMDVRDGNYADLYRMIDRAQVRGASPENFGYVKLATRLQRRWLWLLETLVHLSG